MGYNLPDVKGDWDNDNHDNANRNSSPKHIVGFQVVAEWDKILWKTFEILHIHTHHDDSESGHEELADGADDDGPGWDKYPQIKKLLNPVVADDGIFWVTKDEFFEFFQTVYVSASDMTEYVEDTNHKHK